MERVTWIKSPCGRERPAILEWNSRESEVVSVEIHLVIPEIIYFAFIKHAGRRARCWVCREKQGR